MEHLARYDWTVKQTSISRASLVIAFCAALLATRPAHRGAQAGIGPKATYRPSPKCSLFFLCPDALSSGGFAALARDSTNSPLHRGDVVEEAEERRRLSDGGRVRMHSEELS
jgi:hypothetical protein